MGTCALGSALANGTIIMFVPYLNYSTCQKINATLNLSWDPNSTSINPASDYDIQRFLSRCRRCPNCPKLCSRWRPGRLVLQRRCRPVPMITTATAITALMFSCALSWFADFPQTHISSLVIRIPPRALLAGVDFPVRRGEEVDAVRPAREQSRPEPQGAI